MSRQSEPQPVLWRRFTPRFRNCLGAPSCSRPLQNRNHGSSAMILHATPANEDLVPDESGRGWE